MEPVGLFPEFVIRHHAIFHKQAKALPFFLESGTIIIKYFFQFIGYFLGDVAIDLPYIWITLQVTPANIQRNIRRINYALQQHQKFRNNVFYFICYKNLVTVKLDLIFLNFVALFYFREV